jgi:4-amino-4-deoxy-L-arabinose transferase-like glycosyltransferase
MYVLLPIVCWGAIVFVFVKRGMSKRGAFLSASIIWGVLLTSITELLSLFNALTKEGIAFSWAGMALISSAFFFLTVKKEAHLSFASPSRVEKALSVGIVFLCLATFLTALLAPPNTWDSMTYHMSRVVHWLQNGSVAHYPTNIVRQIELNPWAEFAIAHFQSLSGGDRFANLVQWFGMVGSIFGASLIAGQLGAQKRGQLLAAVLTATIPMGILQASSTQNNYVEAFWLLCFAWSGIRLMKEQSLWGAFTNGASLGLAILTKGTAYLYAFPFFLWFFWGLIKKAPLTPQRVALLMLVVVFTALSFNAGHYYRNWSLFGNPLTSGTDTYSNEEISGKTIVSNIIRNSALHLSTPSKRVNASVEQGVGAIHHFLGIDLNDPKTTWFSTTFAIPRFTQHEDFCGNFLHAMLSAITLALVLCVGTLRRISAKILPYSTAVTVGFLLFCSVLKWQPWHSRLHLPLFVLGTPIIGVVLGHMRRQALVCLTAAVFILAAVTPALRNASRPLVPPVSSVIDRVVHGEALPQTILTANRKAQYFVNNPAMWWPYAAAARYIRKSGARNVGLKLGKDEWEYPLWVLLKGEDGKMPRLEHVGVENRSGTIGLRGFRPDLIVKDDVQGYPVVFVPR